MYETLITEGSGNGSVGEPPTPGWTRPDVGRVVAWCLTIAAVLSVAAVAAQMAGLSGIRISSRILQFSLVALYPSALIVAAAVALSLTEGGTREGSRRRRATRWVEGAVAVCGAAVLVASAYSIAALLAGGRVGAHDFDGTDLMSRVGFAAMTAASGVLAGLALHVIERGRRAMIVDDRGVVSGDAIELPRRRLLDPVVACVVVGATVLVFQVATFAFPGSSVVQGNGVTFSGSGPSVGSRLASASHGFNSLPIAFAALAVVVLLAARTRHAPRDGFSEAIASVAAMIGLLAVLAAGYGVWRAATADVIARGTEWWARASAIATELASGTLGAAAGYARGQRPPAPPAEREPVRTRFDPLAIALGLVLAASGPAIFIATTVVRDDIPIARGERLLQSDPFMLLSVGLALAAAIVVAFSRRESSDPIRRDAMGNAVDAVAAVVALGTLVSTVFVIGYVVGHRDSRRGSGFVEYPIPSLLDSASAAAKFGYVALALVCGILATGVLRLVWDSHRPLIDDEPDDEIPVAELLP